MQTITVDVTSYFASLAEDAYVWCADSTLADYLEFKLRCYDLLPSTAGRLADFLEPIDLVTMAAE